jgi:hypothetical protein
MGDVRGEYCTPPPRGYHRTTQPYFAAAKHARGKSSIVEREAAKDVSSQDRRTNRCTSFGDAKTRKVGL